MHVVWHVLWESWYELLAVAFGREEDVFMRGGVEAGFVPLILLEDILLGKLHAR